MIITDFFPTNMYIPDNVADLVELTLDVEDFALSYPDGWPDAYWTGWLSWENAPELIMVSNADVKIDTTEQTVSVKCTKPDAQNFNVGYISQGFQAFSVNWQQPIDSKCFTDNNGVYYDNRSNVSPYYGSRFINKLDTQGVALDFTNYHFNSLLGLILHVEIEATHEYGTEGGYNYFSGADDLQKFLRGEITIPIDGGIWTKWSGDSNRTLVNYNYVLDINSPDFGSVYPNTWTFEPTAGAKMHIFMCGFRIGPAIDRLDDETLYDYKTLGVTPMFEQKYGNDVFYSAGMFSLLNYCKYICDYETPSTSLAAYETNFFITGSHTNPIADMDNNLIIGGFECDMSIAWNAWYNRILVFSGNCAIMNYTISALYIFRVLSPTEILHALTLNMRASLVSSNDYGFGDYTLVPHISEDNEYLCEWLTGDFDDIKDELRPWQYGDITESEYDPEDLPPYEPPDPTYGDRSAGDENLPNRALTVGSTDGFVTMYALTETQLLNLSGILWAALNDMDFWKSIAVTMYNDFSLDPAHLLDYFVSLRMYPINLSNLNDATRLYHDWVYIGRGAYPLELNSNQYLYTLGSYSETFDGGTVEVKRFHKDFRDYEPYARIVLTVPFCGSVELTPSEVVGFNLRLSYMCDFSTGVIQATCWVQSEVPHIVATLSGSIGATVQMSASSNMEFLQKLATTAVPIATGALAGGIEVVSGSIGMGAAISSSLGATDEVVSSGTQTAKSGHETASSMIDQISAPNVNSSPVHAFGMSAGFSSMQITNAFISIQVRYYEVPDNYARVYGHACNYSTTLSSLKNKGFTVCKNVEVNTLKCTVDEQIRIKQLLETGVFL